MSDARLTSPSAERNRDPILAVLRGLTDGPAQVLEVASGSGLHVSHFAAALPDVTFLPTDADAVARASVDAWAAHLGLANIHPAVALDAARGPWPWTGLDVVMCINMIHIAPWAACLGLLDGAARVLRPGGALLLYGPYRQHGQHTADSNADFDASLRARDPAWGVRDLDTVAAEAAARGFGAPAIHPMPANNLAVVFRADGG